MSNGKRYCCSQIHCLELKYVITFDFFKRLVAHLTKYYKLAKRISAHFFPALGFHRF